MQNCYFYPSMVRCLSVCLYSERSLVVGGLLVERGDGGQHKCTLVVYCGFIGSAPRTVQVQIELFFSPKKNI